MQLTKEQKILGKVIEKAWEDPAFKAELVSTANPVDLIEAVTGETLEVPNGLTLKIYDQTDPSFAHINIPVKPNLDELELTDEQLEMVAGGDAIIITFLMSATLTWMVSAVIKSN